MDTFIAWTYNEMGIQVNTYFIGRIWGDARCAVKIRLNSTPTQVPPSAYARRHFRVRRKHWATARTLANNWGIIRQNLSVEMPMDVAWCFDNVMTSLIWCEIVLQ